MYVFHYGKGETPDMKNYFVRELSKINYLNPYLTSYSLGYELKINILETGENTLEIESILVPEKIYGEVAYRDFDLGTLLLPPMYAFTILIMADGKELHAWESGQLVTGKPVKSFWKLPAGTNPGQDNFDVNGMQFFYDENSAGLFSRRLDEIHEYLAYLELIGYSLTKVKAIDPELSGALFANHFAIYDLERFQTQLNSTAFNPEMGIPDHYDKEFRSGSVELNSNLRRLRTILGITLGNTDLRINDNDYSAAVSKLIEIQIGYLEEMRKTTHFHEPVYLDFAELLKNQEDWNKLSDGVVEQFDKIDSAILRYQLADHLWRKYAEKGDEFYAKEQYNESLLMLTSADVACRSNPQIDCGLQIFNKLSKARFGIYDSYLGIATAAMNVKNYDLARRYLSMAADYQKNNSTLIILPSAVNDLYEKLAWQYFDAGRSAVRAEKWDTAFKYLTASRDIYNQLGKDDFDESILKELSKIRK